MLGLVTDFYGTVVQNITSWTPKAPKITRPAPSVDADVPSVDDPKDLAMPVDQPRHLLGGFSLPPVSTTGTSSPYTPASVREDPDRDTAGPEIG